MRWLPGLGGEVQLAFKRGHLQVMESASAWWLLNALGGGYVPLINVGIAWRFSKE